MKRKGQFVIIVNHENPFICKGGTEKYIDQQSQLYRTQDVDVLVLFPLDLRAILGIPFFHGWGVVENDRFIGIKSVRKVNDIINNYRERKTCVGVHIHNIIDLDIEELYSFVSFRQQITLYIHDYCTCCKQINLRKNREEYCGDSRLYDEKCYDCRFYEKAKKVHKEISDLFSRIPKLRVVAPSETAAVLWSDSYPQYKENIEIVPHLISEGIWKDPKGLIEKNQEMRIAFVGAAVAVKGWPLFKKAVSILKQEEILHDLKFFYFGQSNIPETLGITHIHVSANENDNFAMINALRTNDIDVVVLFSIIPETYSFTYYESLAAHCYIIANKNSGNIAYEVKRRGNGIVLESNEEALADVFKKSEKLRDTVNQFRLSQPESPLAYNKNIKASIDIDENEKKETQHKVKSSAISAFNAEIAYRIRYSSAVTSILPVYNAPKESLHQIITKIKKSN